MVAPCSALIYNGLIYFGTVSIYDPKWFDIRQTLHLQLLREISFTTFRGDM